MIHAGPLIDPDIAGYLIAVRSFSISLTRGSVTGCGTSFGEELHHQGDVAEASYAVLPYLVSHAATLGCGRC